MCKTFIISEIGINHMGDLNLAKEMIYQSKRCGVDAVKLQTYTLEERTDPDSPHYDLFRSCLLNYDQQLLLKEYADNIGIELFSTPFGKESFEFLMNVLKVDKIKLASFDVTNTEFLEFINKYLSNYNRDTEIILSTGMANVEEINLALSSLSECPVCLLHCVSSYPMSKTDANLSAITSLRKLFGSKPNVIDYGYSDHSSGIDIPAASVLVGAKVVEKHFNLDMNGSAIDNPVSANPRMMSDLVERIRYYEEIMGNGEISMRESEKGALQFRRNS